MSASDKIALTDAWSADVWALAMAGVRRRLPDATPAEQLIELGRVLHGDAVVDGRVADVVRRRLGR